MFNAKILNSDAITNNYKQIETLEFLNGTAATLKFQLFNQELALRYIPASTCVITVYFNLSDGTTLSKSGTMNSDDRSMVTVNLSATDTATILGGNIRFDLDINGDASVVYKGIILNALARILEN